jgi:uncharacterized membrane protein YbhN (UPF0104 family)
MKQAMPAIARWAVALVLIAIVCSRFDLAAIAGRIGQANLVLAVPGIAGLVAIHLVGATAWRRLLERFAGIHSDWRPAVRLYYAAQAIGSVTPGNLGADVYRVGAVESGTSRRAAAVPILLQRLTSTLALAVLAGLALLELRWRDLQPLAGGLLVVVALGAGVGLGAFITSRVRGQALARWIAARLHRDDRPIREDALALLRDGFGLGLVFHAASIGFGWMLIVAIDPSTMSRSLDVLAILAIARLSVVLPISPAGLGVQEAAVGILFVEAGLDPQIALAGILLNRVALLLVVVIGAAGLVGRSRVAPPPDPEPSRPPGPSRPREPAPLPTSAPDLSRRPALPARARQ